MERWVLDKLANPVPPAPAITPLAYLPSPPILTLYPNSYLQASEILKPRPTAQLSMKATQTFPVLQGLARPYLLQEVFLAHKVCPFPALLLMRNVW